LQFATNDRVGSAAAEILLGNTASVFMAVLIMMSTFGCNNGLILAGARVYYAMAGDGLFFKKAGVLNKHAVPSNALYMQAVWASLLCLSGSYGALLDYTILAALGFYIVTIGGIFILRRTQPNVPRPYKAFAYPLLPALYIVCALAICINLVICKPENALPCIAIVLTGFPVYFIYKRFNRS
jgi:basic amino acid/polyamine antiporter, APA family